MEKLNLDNHMIRKALKLSLNEMAVLCEIKNTKGIKSKDKIAEWLDLSRGTVFNAINTLEYKGYIERKKGVLSLSPLLNLFDTKNDQ